tara:strand:- start:52 stop:336 length:285 start_codon:yes stop_codon:yes gene_type:complete
MALAKTTEIDKVEVVGPYKAVQVRTATVITEDGVELSRSSHRHVLVPGNLGVGSTLVDEDISAEDPSVQAICNAVWTDAIKESYRQFLVGIGSD